MYAIIEQGSHQYQVRPDTTIDVFRLNLEPGADFTSDKVLLVGEEGGAAQVGSPYLAGYTVKGTVMGHYRDRKIVVFKMKRRKDYRRKQGHRQEITRIKIDSILQGKATSASPKSQAAPETKAESAPEAAAETAPAAATEAAQTAPKAKQETAAASAAKPKAAAEPKKETATAGGKSEAKTTAKPKAAAKPKSAAKPKKAQAKDED